MPVTRQESISTVFHLISMDEGCAPGSVQATPWVRGDKV